MSQVSLIGYFVGGAFLSLAYFDLPYYIMVALIATKWILERERKSSQVTARGGLASTAATLRRTARRNGASRAGTWRVIDPPRQTGSRARAG